MRVEYLTVQRALLPDSRIILELLVEFIDMILCIIIHKMYPIQTVRIRYKLFPQARQV